MNYISTRGQAPSLGFEDVMLAGLARDGGLYVPENWPQFSPQDIASIAGLSYCEAAFEVMWPFLGRAIGEDAFRAMLEEAYGTFRHRAVAPLVQIGDNDWILELFHGPTLAFKDVAMQILARLMDDALIRRGQRATIVGATSGDTGSAAIEAFRGRDAIDIFILHPKGRVSEVQRRQMTTVLEPNVYNIAVRGTFDDAQALVKGMFNDLSFRDGVALTGVNSINWARIMAQIVYYFTASVSLGAPHRPVSFTVPTGNFGDIFAGYAARRMGLPVERLVVATNVNDILARTLRTGRYETSAVTHTASPSMDIQVASNFERLLFDLFGRDGAAVVASMKELTRTGGFAIGADQLEQAREIFTAERVDEKETREAIRDLYETAGVLADPHTAVGLAAADKCRGERTVPMITLSTAHPAKFPDAVKKAAGVDPQLPAHLSDLLQRDERLTVLENDLGQVQEFVRARSRACRGAAE